jgi:hypothetical protein
VNSIDILTQHLRMFGGFSLSDGGDIKLVFGELSYMNSSGREIERIEYETVYFDCIVIVLMVVNPRLDCVGEEERRRREEDEVTINGRSEGQATRVK